MQNIDDRKKERVETAKTWSVVEIKVSLLEKPQKLQFPDGSLLLVKLDCIYHTNDYLVIGGWASSQLIPHLEQGGVLLAPLECENFDREDVNSALKISKDKMLGFSGIWKISHTNQLSLTLKGSEVKYALRVKLEPQEITNYWDDFLRPALSSDVYRSLWDNVLRARKQLVSNLVHAFDTCFRFDDNELGTFLLLQGWCYSPVEFNLIMLSGGNETILEPVWWHRPDINSVYGECLVSGREGHGFMVLAHVPEFLDETPMFFAEADGFRRKLAYATVENVYGYVNFIKKIFSIPIFYSELSRIYHLLIPKLSSLQKSYIKRMQKRKNISGCFNTPPDRPDTSIIICLYGTLEMLTTQIMCFSEDPELMDRAELIYVIDDISLLESFKIMADELSKLYSVPIRWISKNANQGFSAANNLGASVARGDTLIFVNSDVFPTKRGWSTELRNYLRRTPGVGLVGCRLLYPNGSLQHAGMKFLYRDSLRIWSNIHPLAGADPVLDPCNKPAEKDAVTGACIGMSKKDFQSIGGWTTDYILGDFEDSDLCLKIRSIGKKIIYLPDVTMIHLERQSVKLIGDEGFRQRLTIFNAFIHQSKWLDMLTALGGTEKETA